MTSHFSRFVTLALVSAHVAWSQPNITIHFSREGHGPCEPGAQPAFTLEGIPHPRSYDGVCYNLDELFAGNSTAPTNARDYSDVKDRNPLGATALNSAAWDPHANYSRIWYQQTNESWYGETGTNEMAARQLTVYPERNCTQGKGYPPRELGMAAYYSWNCQSEVEGSCYSTPQEIKSFYIRSAATFHDIYGKKQKCWDMEARGTAAGLHVAVGSYVAIFVAVASAIILC